MQWRLLMEYLVVQLLVIVLAFAINCANGIEEEVQRQKDMLAYCRTLQRLQEQYDDSSCAQILQDELTMTGELLMDTQRRCWWGWELSGRRCRKRV